MGFAMFNPCSPCCGGGDVLIYAANEFYGQDYSSLSDVFVAAGITPDYIPKGQTLPPGTKLLKYSLIFIPMPGDVTADLTLLALKTWLNAGGVRLVITGEYGPTFDAVNIITNNILSYLSSSISCQLGFTIANGGCLTPYSTPTQTHYLTSGIGNWKNAASTKISGGSILAGDGFGTTLAVEKINGSEIIVSGDSNCFGGQCSNIPELNKVLIKRMRPRAGKGGMPIQ